MSTKWGSYEIKCRTEGWCFKRHFKASWYFANLPNSKYYIMLDGASFILVKLQEVYASLLHQTARGVHCSPGSQESLLESRSSCFRASPLRPERPGFVSGKCSTASRLAQGVVCVQTGNKFPFRSAALSDWRLRLGGAMLCCGQKLLASIVSVLVGLVGKFVLLQPFLLASIGSKAYTEWSLLCIGSPDLCGRSVWSKPNASASQWMTGQTSALCDTDAECLLAPAALKALRLLLWRSGLRWGSWSMRECLVFSDLVAAQRPTPLNPTT